MKELLELIKDNKPEEAKELLLKNKEEIDLDYADKKVGNAALIIACEKGYNEVAEILLEKGASPDFVPESTARPTLLRCNAMPRLNNLTYADWQNHEYQQRCSGTRGSYYRETPLIIAIIENNIELVSILLKYNADIYKCDKTKKLPMYFASRNCNVRIIDLLIKKGIKQNKNSLNQALVAISINEYNKGFTYLRFIEFLIENEVDINYKVSDRESILTCLINTGKFKEARYLISRGAIVYEEVILALVNKFPIKCKYFNESDKNEDYENLLRDSRIEYFLKNAPIRNVIIEKAAIKGNVEMLRVLLDIGLAPDENFLCKTLKQLKISDFSLDIFINNKISIELIKNGYLNNFSEELLDCKKIMCENIPNIINELLVLIDEKIKMYKDDKNLIDIKNFFATEIFNIINNNITKPQCTPQIVANNILFLKSLIRKIKSEIIEDALRVKTPLPIVLNIMIVQCINNKDFNKIKSENSFKKLSTDYINKVRLGNQKIQVDKSLEKPSLARE